LLPGVASGRHQLEIEGPRIGRSAVRVLRGGPDDRRGPNDRVVLYHLDVAARHAPTVRIPSPTPRETVVTMTYEPGFDQLASVTDPINQTTTLTYDTLGRLTTITDPLSHQTTVTSNAAG
jgi:YD repeat-containing protein